MVVLYQVLCKFKIFSLIILSASETISEERKINKYIVIAHSKTEQLLQVAKKRILEITTKSSTIFLSYLKYSIVQITWSHNTF
jgi:hypothetical protein